MDIFEGSLMTARCLCLLVLMLVMAPARLTSAEPPAKDYTDVKLDELGIKLAEPKKEPKTGFVVGGKNPTSLVKKLTEINGIPIADLEKAMRPGALSTAGFLGKEERLLDVLGADNQYVVDDLGLTHQELAKQLQVLWAIGKRANDKPFTYHGRRFKVTVLFAKGFQESPFRDGTKTNSDTVVQNLDNGKTLGFSLLVPLMMERYGFYEGKGTPYRVDPHAVVETLDFLKSKSGKAR
jgi:hypothetical protein